MGFNMNLKKVEYSATILSITGAILNIFMLWICFVVWIIANILWIYLGYKKEIKGMVLTFIVFLITSISGLYLWW